MDLTPKIQNTKLLEEDTLENLHDPGFGNDFHKTPIARFIKKR